MTIEEKKNFLLEIADSSEFLEVARLAVENSLIEFRDARISQPMRGNGLVCKEKDGQRSDLIRMGTETAVKIGLIAIAENL